MLNPNARGLYTTALTPPLGMVFDEALGMTFSLDPSVLLSVPVHLALLAGDEANPLRDGIAVLEAMRRLADRITVFTQRGRLQVPDPPNPLYGLLESMVVEVTAPRGGVFHPKVWVLRFRQPHGGAVMLRLLVLSRNLTLDRSWDLALTLEGSPGGRYVAENRVLGELIAATPGWSTGRAIDDARRAQAERLADELRRTPLSPPPGFESLAFHVLGRTRGPWSPGPGNRMAVISPFLGADALAHLLESRAEPVALISRPETLSALDPAVRGRFKDQFTLHDAAETEDGEAIDGEARDTCGLHAKAYIVERGWRTHLFVGSANATDAALLGASNVEVLVELVGKRSQVGDIERLLSADGLGEVLAPFVEPPEAPPRDAEREAAETALEEARRRLEAAALQVRCERGAEGGDRWSLRLVAAAEVSLPENVSSLRVWPITIASDRAVTVGPGDHEAGIDLGEYGAASITGLVAFEITTNHPHVAARFVLNLPVDGLPAERDDAIVQTVVNNREGFLRYLMLLLSGLTGDADLPGLPPPSGDGDHAWRRGGFDDLPLLEEMVRAFCREPGRLHEIDDVVRRLARPAEDGEPVVPETFLELWRVFESALGARRG
jgi:hypothetical protein